MCFPALIPIAIGAGMGLMQGQQKQNAANQEAADLRTNALYLNQTADDIVKRGGYNADWQRVETQGVIGAQRVAQASNGGVVDQDSNAILVEDTAQLGELDALTISNNAAREAYGYQVEATGLIKNASTLKQNAKNAVMTSVIGGALGGMGSSFGGGSMFGGAGASQAVNGQAGFRAGVTQGR